MPDLPSPRLPRDRSTQTANVRSAIVALGIVTARAARGRHHGEPPTPSGPHPIARVPQTTAGDGDRHGAAADGDAAAALAEMEEALTACAQALADLAHDARGEMTAIKGRAQLMRRRVLVSERPDLGLVRGLEEIAGAVDRLEALIAANLDPPSPAQTQRPRPPDPTRRT